MDIQTKKKVGIHMSTFTEKLAIKLLSDNLRYHYAGLENSVLDGEMTPEELSEVLTEEKMIEVSNDFLKEAYKEGYLESEYSSVILEAKHLKFLGTDKLNSIKRTSAVKALEYF